MDLDLCGQLKIIDKTIEDKKYLQKFGEQIYNFLERDNSDLIKKNKTSIINNYNLKMYYHRMMQIIQDTLTTGCSKVDNINNDYIIKYFLKPGTFGSNCRSNTALIA